MVLGERADARRVFSIALREMVEIAGSYGAIARAAVGLGLTLPAVSLARTLTSLDRHLEHGTLRDASLATLARYGVELRVDGPAPPRRGPLLVVANHPGLFDALALFAAVARDDLAILAKRRELLDALPNVKRRLVTIEAGESGGLAVRGALRHLRRGGAVLHFPAGEIEPDPRLAAPGEPALGAWRPGLEAMTRLAARSCPEALLVPALVSGVISPRARAVSHKIAGRSGATDALVPLLQLTLPGFRDVDVRVRFGDAHPVAESAEGELPTIRERLESLAPMRAR